jgi:hypothetical protein
MIASAMIVPAPDGLSQELIDIGHDVANNKPFEANMLNLWLCGNQQLEVWRCDW